jgi:ribosomal protein S18 acetylase RimI-like enzyme
MVIQGKYFTIKNVDVNDIDAIFEVYKQCEDFLALGPVPNASKQMILDDFKISEEEGGTFCGIFINDEMVGVVDFVLSNFDGKPNNAFLSLLMISKCHRRKGIGKDIVKAVEMEILKNHSIESILAGVQTNNEPAIAFWQEMGYKVVSGPELLPDTTIVFGLKKDIVR